MKQGASRAASNDRVPTMLCRLSVQSQLAPERKTPIARRTHPGGRFPGLNGRAERLSRVIGHFLMARFEQRGLPQLGRKPTQSKRAVTREQAVSARSQFGFKALSSPSFDAPDFLVKRCKGFGELR